MREPTSETPPSSSSAATAFCPVLAPRRHVVGLLSKGLAQPLLVLRRKVGRDDLEVKLLELLDHPVLRSPAGQRKQRRRPGCYLLAYRLDEVIVDTHVDQGTAERSHSRAHGHPKQRYKEDQPEQKAPECATDRARTARARHLAGLGLLALCWPGDDRCVL